MSDKSFFDMRKILEESIHEEQKNAAKGIFVLFQDFCEVGFTEDQALKIVMSMLSSGIGNKKGE